MDLAQANRQLRQLYDAGQTFRFVEQAYQVLRQAPQAGELASLTLRALVELGFGGPARELLQSRYDLDAEDSKVAALKEQVRSLPNGRVQWSQYADVFRKNVAALLRHQPDLEHLAASLPKSLSGVHLFRTVQGHFHIAKQRPAGRLREWLPNLTVEASVELPAHGQCGVSSVIGLSLGPLIRRVCDLTHGLFLTYSHPVYLFEPDIIRLAAWLHCEDHSELLDDERVYLFVGSDAVERFGACLADEPGLAVPEIFVNQCGIDSFTEQVRQAAQRVQTMREAELGRLVDDLESRYRDRGSAYWAEHFKPPGRVLAVTSRHTTMLQYSARDTLQALERLGYEPHLLIEAKDHHQFSTIDMYRSILDLDPVMLFFLDHLRYENPHFPKSIPFLTWIQDSMANLLCRRAGESIGPFDFVCGYFVERCVKEFGYPEKRFASVDIPVSTRVFHDEPLDAQSQEIYGCDVSFVSNASTPIDRFYESITSTYPEAHRPILDRVYPRVCEMLEQDEHKKPFDAVLAMVRSVATEVGASIDDRQLEFIATNFAYRVFDWGRRQQSLEWVAAWARRTGRRLRIYGRGWEDHPTLAEFAAGPLEHGEALRRAHRGSKLALQLIPSGFRHQRSYELLASGTLPLTRYCHADYEEDPDCPLAFPDLARISFRTADEYEALAERFLEDEAYRGEVSRELRNVVLRSFTYEVVVGKVMDAFGSEITKQAIPALVPC